MENMVTQHLSLFSSQSPLQQQMLWQRMILDAGQTKKT